MSIQVLWPFFKLDYWVFFFFFLVVNYKNSLFILDINS